MRLNTINERWNSNKNVINGWLAIPDSFSAEVIASLGYDSITVDMQHGLIDFQRAVSMLQAISNYNIAPLVRVPWNEPGIIMKSLDAGAYGIICPMINNKLDCKKFVQATLYPPSGIRSFGPARARLYGGDDYWNDANNTITNFAMIETTEAVTNLSEILSVSGLKAIYVGPTDLAVSLGLPPLPMLKDKKLLDTVKYILKNTKQSNIKAGIHCPDGKTSKEMLNMGFNFVSVSADYALMAKAAKLELELARK